MLPYQDKVDPWSSHSILRRWLKDLPPGSVVLDIGAASGTLGRMCQGMGFRLLGVEPNPAWAEKARPFYHSLFIGPVQAAPGEFIEKADVIVLADVLEHIADPRQVLDDLAARAAPGCLFMVSVPNVANLWVRLSLLCGHFDYSERGILDRTHLRFFTRSSFFDLISKSGIKIQECTSTPVPLNLVHPFFERRAFGRWLHQMLARITTGFPTLLGYQFVALAIKK